MATVCYVMPAHQPRQRLCYGSHVSQEEMNVSGVPATPESPSSLSARALPFLGSESSVGSVGSVDSVGSVESEGSVESVSRVKGVSRKTIGAMTSLAVHCVSPPRLCVPSGPETGHLPGEGARSDDHAGQQGCTRELFLPCRLGHF